MEVLEMKEMQPEGKKNESKEEYIVKEPVINHL